MSSLFFILLCCWGSLIIHLWFYSDFFAYYLRLFKFIIPNQIYRWLLVEEYLNNQDPNLNFDSYIDFFYVKKSFSKSFSLNFFLKLFSCINCLTTWVALIIVLIYQNLWYMGLAFIILRILDFILRFVLKKQI
jgi:hypothetical protein